MPILSLPAGVVAFWCVGAGLHLLALLATLAGGLCLYFGEGA